MGGTLAQLVASLGTPYAFDPPEGYVLFLEDVGERPFRIDRMLTQLRLAGVLDRASAVVLGEFVGLRRAWRRARGEGRACGSAEGLQRTGRLWVSVGTHPRSARDPSVRRAARASWRTAIRE